MAVQVLRHRFTVEEYHRMGEAGILSREARVELLEGEIIEVSDTSGEYDRTVKLPLYARAGIAEVWIVDLVAQCVEIYRGPGPGGYEQVERLGRGQVVLPQAFPDLQLPVQDVLG